jgi:hypothetical protein
MLFWLLSYYYLVHCGHGKLIPKRLLHIVREIRGHERYNQRSERGLGGRTTRAQYTHRQPGASPTISRSDWIPSPDTPTVTQRIAHMQCELVLENYDCTSHPRVQYRGHRINPDKL